jgi:hypothetical protein
MTSLNIVNNTGIIKSRRMEWAGHIAPMEEKGNSNKIFVQFPERKSSFGRCSQGWEDKVIRWEIVEWMHVAQDRHIGGLFMKKVAKFWVQY